MEFLLKRCVFVQDAESEAAKALEKAAEAVDDIPFAMTSSDDVYSKFEVSKDGIILFKKVFLYLNITFKDAALVKYKRVIPALMKPPCCFCSTPPVT